MSRSNLPNKDPFSWWCPSHIGIRGHQENRCRDGQFSIKRTQWSHVCHHSSLWNNLKNEESISNNVWMPSSPFHSRRIVPSFVGYHPGPLSTDMPAQKWYNHLHPGPCVILSWVYKRSDTDQPLAAASYFVTCYKFEMTRFDHRGQMRPSKHVHLPAADWWHYLSKACAIRFVYLEN